AFFKVRHDRFSVRGVLQKRQRKGRPIVGVPASVQRQRRGGVPLCLLSSPEEGTPHRTSALKQGGPFQQTSDASQADRAVRQRVGFFEAPLARQGQRFLVLEPSLSV